MVKRWKPGRVRNGIKKEEIPTTVDVTMEIIKKRIGGAAGRDDSWPTDLCYVKSTGSYYSKLTTIITWMNGLSNFNDFSG